MRRKRVVFYFLKCGDKYGRYYGWMNFFSIFSFFGNLIMY